VPTWGSVKPGYARFTLATVDTLCLANNVEREVMYVTLFHQNPASSLAVERLSVPQWHCN